MPVQEAIDLTYDASEAARDVKEGNANPAPKKRLSGFKAGDMHGTGPGVYPIL